MLAALLVFVAWAGWGVPGALLATALYQLMMTSVTFSIVARRAGGFQIDRRFQRRGYGRAALVALIEALRDKPGCREIVLTYLPANDPARRLYASVGFTETGEMLDDEVVARLGVTPRTRRRA